jgi:hypothetical protein
MARHSFCIDLSPGWKDAVQKSGYTQEHMNNLTESMGRDWLDCAGYDRMYDPDNCGFDADPKAPLGPNARKLYEPRTSLRISWGEWGPEHLTVPGSACGLDLDQHTIGSVFDDGRMLTPHNVDSWGQKYLLLMMFTYIAESIYLAVAVK